MERRRAAGTKSARRRHDLARGGPGRSIAHEQQSHQDQQHSAELYAGLEKETGHPVGWKQVGSLIAAKARTAWFSCRTAAMSGLFGVEVQIVGPKSLRKNGRYCEPTTYWRSVVAARWQSAAQRSCVGSRERRSTRRATIVEQCRTLDVEHTNGRVIGSNQSGPNQSGVRRAQAEWTANGIALRS
jgi:hypothetical protein